MTQAVLREYQRFRGTTGCVGQDARVSLAWAKARLAVQAAGCVWGWEDDADGWHEARQWDHGTVETCESCVLYGPDGAVLGSLSGIWDADEQYRRIVEAELACEAMPLCPAGWSCVEADDTFELDLSCPPSTPETW